jgi:hypothetical protein
VLLQRSRGVLGLVAAPELLDQALARDDAARLEQEESEEAPLLDAAEPQLPLALPHLERPEHAEVEATSQEPKLPRLSAA